MQKELGALRGRLDLTRVAAVGHSFGGETPTRNERMTVDSTGWVLVLASLHGRRLLLLRTAFVHPAPVSIWSPLAEASSLLPLRSL